MPDFEHRPVTDVASVAARCGSDTLRLEPEWPTVLHWMRRLGRVVARTENAHAIIAQHGRFGRPAFVDARRAFLGGDFVVACRLDRWKALFATIDADGRRELRVFDEFGAGIGAIDVSDPAGRSGFDEMVWRLHARDQSPVEATSPFCPLVERPDVEIDAEALAAALAEAETPQRRTGVLARFGVSREQSLRLGGSRAGSRVHVPFVRALLEAIADRRMDVACAVGNPAAIHAHVGRVTRFDGTARWTLSFAMRAKASFEAAAIASAWLVRTPRGSGVGHSVELFGPGGTPIASLAGVRRPDGSEPADWRRLLASLGPSAEFA